MTDAASPLDAEQLRAVHAARQQAASFLGAARVATFNGWSLAVCAGLSLLLSLSSPLGLLVGLALALIARNEFEGRRRLLAFDEEGLQLLWRNQVGLMALIVAYCVWSIVRGAVAPDPQEGELMDLLGEGTAELVRSLTLTVLGVAAGLAVIIQGLNARYYFVRIARLRTFLRETPSWVRSLL